MKPDAPSSTALLIAASTVFTSQDAPRADLVSREAAELCSQFLRTAGRPASYALNLVPKSWFRRVTRTIEDHTIPGIQTHYALRKRFLRDWVVHNVRGGFSQVVSLGAGFDTLCLELHAEFPDVRFIEVDHPATQRVKLQALAAMGVRPGNLFFATADLSASSLSTALAACVGFAPYAGTLFVAEGLLMYLERDRVSELLACIARRGKDRIAFTFLEPRRNGKPNFRSPSRLVDLWLDLRGERFRWGIPRSDLGSFLATCGLHPTEITDDGTFGRYFPDQSASGGVPEVGEYICVAEATAPSDRESTDTLH